MRLTNGYVCVTIVRFVCASRGASGKRRRSPVDLQEKSFDRYMAVKELLEEILFRKVDLVLKSAIKPRLREGILREAVRAP